jgi:hypothetical protein
VVAPLNYVRTPALGAALLLVMFLPGIIEQGAGTYRSATGLTQAPYLGRWLILTAVMFGVSAVVYAIRSRGAGAPERAVVRHLTPLLAQGERVVTVAYRASGVAAAVCTTHALRYLVEGGLSVWRRLGWADVAELRWHPDGGVVEVTCLAGAPVERAMIPLAGRGNLVEVAHDLIATTAVVTVTTFVGASEQAVITVRRCPRTEQLLWRVRLAGDVDPGDPDVRGQVDAAIVKIADDLGLASPRTTAGWHDTADEEVAG